MNKIYLIDSENVNDAWVNLLPGLEPEDRIIVFYTAKSPHMCYQNLITLIQNKKEIQFIECFEGNNALDFQLVSHLGFLLRDMPDFEYRIVTNDTGFDAIVKYWKKKDYHIMRMKGKECYAVAQKCKETVVAAPPTTDEANDVPIILEAAGDLPTIEEVKESWAGTEVGAVDMEAVAMEVEGEAQTAFTMLEAFLKESGFGQEKEMTECIHEMMKVISMNKMAQFHNALTCMFGQKQGDGIYAFLKEHRTQFMKEKSAGIPKKKERECFYITLILANAGMEEDGELLYKVYSDTSKKDLSSLNTEILNKFGKEKGAKYYSLLKKHLKVISKL